MYSKICIIHVIPPPTPQYVFFAEFPNVIYPLRLKSVHLFQLSSVVRVYILRAFLKYTKSLICCEFCCLSINRYKIILQIILKILYFKYYLHPVLYFCKDLRWRVILGWMIKLGWTKQKQTSFCYVQIIKGGKWMVETSLYRTPLMSELRCVRRV